MIPLHTQHDFISMPLTLAVEIRLHQPTAFCVGHYLNYKFL